MTLAIWSAVIGVAALALMVYETICLMRVRQYTGERPGFREMVRIAWGGSDLPAEVVGRVRRALAARLASYAGIAAVAVMLAML